MTEPKGFKLDFAFIPFPEETIDAQPPLLQCEWQLLGYLLLQIRFGEALQPLADDELINGIIEGGARIDHGCGLSRNGIKKARESLAERGWLLLANVSNDPSRPRWMYRLVLKRRAVTARQQVSQRDSGTNGQEVSQQVTELSGFDSAVSQRDSAVSQRDTSNKEDRKYLKKNHIENTKAEITAAPVENPAQQQKQANLDSWDLRRWQEAMGTGEAQVGRNVEDADADWRSQARRAAFVAGLTPGRIVELLKQHFPNDPNIDLLYPDHPRLFPQPQPPQSEDEIRSTIERGLAASGGAA